MSGHGWDDEVNSFATDRVLAINDSALITTIVGLDGPSIMVRRIDDAALELVRRYRTPDVPVGLWHPDSLDGLESLDADMDSVVLTSGAALPVEALYRLPPTVRRLDIYGPAFAPRSVDVGELSGVAELTISFALLAPGPWPQRLERVSFIDGSPKTLDDLPRSTSVRSLTLSGLKTLDGLERFPHLRQLALSRTRHLDGLGPLQYVHDLEFLELNRAAGLPPLDPIADLLALSKLWLLDCGRVPSLKPLAGHPSLVDLLAYGSTDVQDGDLAPLLTIPRLRRLALASRRKYRPKVSDVVRERGLTTS